MTETVNMMTMARDLMTHAQERQKLLARNVANADTPGFRSRDLDQFARLVDSGPLGRESAMHATRQGHFTGAGWPGIGRQIDVGGEASPNGNNVSIEEEMFREADIQREHRLALGVYEGGLRLMRGALGRR